jgi:hypothetical protein
MTIELFKFPEYPNLKILMTDKISEYDIFSIKSDIYKFLNDVFDKISWRHYDSSTLDIFGTSNNIKYYVRIQNRHHFIKIMNVFGDVYEINYFHILFGFNYCPRGIHGECVSNKKTVGSLCINKLEVQDLKDPDLKRTINDYLLKKIIV